MTIRKGREREESTQARCSQPRGRHDCPCESGATSDKLDIFLRPTFLPHLPSPPFLLLLLEQPLLTGRRTLQGEAQSSTHPQRWLPSSSERLAQTSERLLQQPRRHLQQCEGHLLPSTPYRQSLSASMPPFSKHPSTAALTLKPSPLSTPGSAQWQETTCPTSRRASRRVKVRSSAHSAR